MFISFSTDNQPVPEDAAMPRIIKSVPGPDENQPSGGGLGATALQEAADNPISSQGAVRGGGVGEGITGTGHELPASTTAKPGGLGGKSGNHGGHSHKENGL